MKWNECDCNIVLQSLKLFFFCFSRFATKESATHAIVAVHNTEINGQTVKCSWGKEAGDPANVSSQVSTVSFFTKLHNNVHKHCAICLFIISAHLPPALFVILVLRNVLHIFFCSTAAAIRLRIRCWCTIPILCWCTTNGLLVSSGGVPCNHSANAEPVLARDAGLLVREFCGISAGLHGVRIEKQK